MTDLELEVALLIFKLMDSDASNTQYYSTDKMILGKWLMNEIVMRAKRAA